MLRSILLLLVSTQLVACTEPDAQPDLELFERLQAIPGMSVEEGTSPFEGYRYFVMLYDQPADHAAASSSAHFEQRILLLHKDEAAPMVLGTSGYSVNPAKPRIREAAQLLGANQLWVEQRWFLPSRPEPADWSLLTIEQAAADHHRIVEALEPIYSGKWISAGASKGGMTSVYHRRFYPDDVDGTIAYVAPHSFGTSDPRYLDFVAGLGEADCRAKLMDFQREVLTRRTAMLERQANAVASEGMKFDLLGADKALETAAVELVFTFWQYFDASLCPDVPTAASTDDEVWGFLDKIASPLLWSDPNILAYEPYYWQAAVELGYPALEEGHLADLMQYPGLDVPSTYIVPESGKTPTFDPAAMKDISDWLSAQGERFLFVYGANDPYTAAAFDLGAAKDSYRFVIPGENHSASLLDLAETDQKVAFDALERWTGVRPVVPSGQALEVHEGPRWDRF